MTDREEFEKWADDAGFDCIKNKLTNADYEQYDTHSAWIAWQARGLFDAERIKELEAEIKTWQEIANRHAKYEEEADVKIDDLTAKLDKAKEALKCIDEDLVNPVHYILVKEVLEELDK